MIKVGIVILNYNNYEDTLACISSLNHLNETENKVYVVDNCSTNESYVQLNNNLPEFVQLIQSGENGGYAAGNNIGIKKAIEEGCTHICVLNNDTVVTCDFLEECIDYLENHHEVAFVGPAILDFMTGLVQSTGGDIIMSHGRVTMKNNGIHLDELPAEIESDYIGGACIISRTEVINKIGFIPENYFLFFEETEWCYRAKMAGYKNVCLSSTSIRHKGSASVTAIGDLQEYLMERNRVVFVRRNSSKPQFAVFFIYVLCRNLYISIFRSSKYFSNFKSYFDGLFNRVSKKYPFVKCMR